LIERFPARRSFRNRVGLFTLGVFIMSMVIGTNVSSITAQRHLANSQVAMETSMERLASGKRINSAMDDAAGLGIAARMTAQVEGMNQGIRNANDGLSMVAVAEGALEEVSTMLLRLREIAVAGSSETYTTADLASMDAEFNALVTEIERISDVTKFNGTAVAGGASTKAIQVGAASGDSITLTFKDMGKASIGAGADTALTYGTTVQTTATNGTTKEKFTLSLATAVATGKVATYTVNGNEYRAAFRTDHTTTMSDLASLVGAGEDVTATSTSSTLVLEAKLAGGFLPRVGVLNTVTPNASGSLNTAGVDTKANAVLALTILDKAIDDVTTYRGALGATASALQSSVSNLMARSESAAAAASQIMDADYATESANLAKAQVLQQAGTAMLAQANASGQSVLSLLK
jgi:flagellin